MNLHFGTFLALLLLSVTTCTTDGPFICGAESACPTDVRSYLEYTLRAYHNIPIHVADAIISQRQARVHMSMDLNIVHIGCNTLKPGKATSELYRFMSLDLHQSSKRARMIMVDADPAMEVGLVNRLRDEYDANLSNVDFVLGALCDDYTDKVVFHKLDVPLALNNFPDLIWYQNLSSLGRIGKDALLQDLGNFSQLGWFGSLLVPWEDYVINVTVPCVTPRSLLDRVRMPVVDVDILIVDTPRSAHILEKFLALDDFSPVAIRFQGIWGYLTPDLVAPGGLISVMTILAGKGYSMYYQSEFLWAIAARQ